VNPPLNGRSRVKVAKSWGAARVPIKENVVAEAVRVVAIRNTKTTRFAARSQDTLQVVEFTDLSFRLLLMKDISAIVG
jgi:hypothetical protein